MIQNTSVRAWKATGAIEERGNKVNCSSWKYPRTASRSLKSIRVMELTRRFINDQGKNHLVSWGKND
jgi:hypothetical protein